MRGYNHAYKRRKVSGVQPLAGCAGPFAPAVSMG